MPWIDTLIENPYREIEMFLWKSGQKIDRMATAWVTVPEKPEIIPNLPYFCHCSEEISPAKKR